MTAGLRGRPAHPGRRSRIPRARARGIVAASLAQLVSQPQVAVGVAAANQQLAWVQQVKRWRLLPVEWTAETEELTLTLEPKCRVVHASMPTSSTPYAG